MAFGEPLFASLKAHGFAEAFWSADLGYEHGSCYVQLLVDRLDYRAFPKFVVCRVCQLLTSLLSIKVDGLFACGAA